MKPPLPPLPQHFEARVSGFGAVAGTLAPPSAAAKLPVVAAPAANADLKTDTGTLGIAALDRASESASVQLSSQIPLLRGASAAKLAGVANDGCAGNMSMSAAAAAAAAAGSFSEGVSLGLSESALAHATPKSLGCGTWAAAAAMAAAAASAAATAASNAAVIAGPRYSPPSPGPRSPPRTHPLSPVSAAVAGAVAAAAARTAVSGAGSSLAPVSLPPDLTVNATACPLGGTNPLSPVSAAVAGAVVAAAGVSTASAGPLGESRLTPAPPPQSLETSPRAGGWLCSGSSSGLTVSSSHGACFTASDQSAAGNDSGVCIRATAAEKGRGIMCGGGGCDAADLQEEDLFGSVVILDDNNEYDATGATAKRTALAAEMAAAEEMTGRDPSVEKQQPVMARKRRRSRAAEE